MGRSAAFLCLGESANDMSHRRQGISVQQAPRTMVVVFTGDDAQHRRFKNMEYTVHRPEALGQPDDERP